MHLQLFPVNYAHNFFTAQWGARASSAPPGYAYVSVNDNFERFDVRSSHLHIRYISREHGSNSHSRVVGLRLEGNLVLDNFMSFKNQLESLQ